MATYTTTSSTHQTLTADTIDTVTLNRVRSVEVLNRGSADIYFTANGSTPAVSGDGCFVVMPGSALQVSNGGAWDSGTTTVKLISNAATAYSVTAT